MPRPNSSTSSSDVAPAAGRRDAAWTLAWTLAILAALDVATSLAFRSPRDPKKPPSSLQAYFQYGRSIEGKLDRLIGPTDETSSPIAFAGWLEPPLAEGEPTSRGPGVDLLAAFYGMSFSNQIAEALGEVDPKIAARKVGGPASPPSHVLDMYEADRGRSDADVVVFTVMDSAVEGILSNNGFCRNFEGPQPFLYRRYFTTPGGLEAHEPPVRSLAEFRAAWFDPQGRGRLIEDVRTWDLFYHPFYFRKNILDESSIARMIRRALFRSHEQSIQRLYEADGRFLEDSEPIRLLKAIVERFLTDAEADGKRPLVLMIQNRGSGSRLHDVLGPLIDARKALSLNTDSIRPSSDGANYLPDGHFTPAANRELAEALAETLRTSAPTAPAPG